MKEIDDRTAWIAISQVDIDAIELLIELASMAVETVADSAAVTVAGMFLQAAKDAYSTNADSPLQKYGAYSLWQCDGDGYEDELEAVDGCGWVGYLSETVHPKHDASKMLCPLCHSEVELIDKAWIESNERYIVTMASELRSANAFIGGLTFNDDEVE